jgi:hypothetical protein
VLPVLLAFHVLVSAVSAPDHLLRLLLPAYHHRIRYLVHP